MANTPNKFPNISGSISSRPNLSGTVSANGGASDHNRLKNRDLPDQHPIKAITGLQELLDSKVSSEDIAPLINDATKSKARGLYYDARGELSKDKKSYWYLTSDIDPFTKQGTKETVISGPYNLGAGGGGTGPSITTVTLLKGNWPSTVSLGGKCIITVNWSSLRDEQPTGRGTLQCFNNGKLLETRTVAQGEVAFDISSSIVSGENKIEIKVVDAYGSSKNLIDIITGISLKLTSYFSANAEFTGDISYIYTPYGDIEKHMHFILDGAELPGSEIITKSGEQQTKIIPAQPHGSHTLNVYFTVYIEGEEIRSNELYYDLICYVDGNKTPVIASTFINSSEHEQYIPFSVPYRVFTPGQNTSKVYLYIDGQSLYTDELGQPAFITVDKNEQNWEVSSDVIGSHTLKIVSGSAEKLLTFHIYQSTVDVTPVTDSLELYLSAENRSNQEVLEKRRQWNYDSPSGLIEGSLNGFNWQSNGWVVDDQNKTVLRLSGDARVTIHFKPFAKDFTNTGKTLEFEIATRDVKDYEERIINCLDGADSISNSVHYAGEDTRTKKFIVTNIMLNTFAQAVQSAKGTYVFIYNNGRWELNDDTYSTEELNSVFGIEIVTQDLDPSNTTETEYFLNNDRILVYYAVSGRGFYITPQIARLQSQAASLSTQYKEDDKVRISYVVEKASYGTRLMFMYINGILSGVSRYSETDSFAQTPAQEITLGSNKATLDVYNIRIYSNDLSRRQIVNNWIADTKDAALKAQRYRHNDVYNNETGQITKEKILSIGNIPYMTLEGDDLPKQKKDRKWMSITYVDPIHSDRSFTADDARVDVQGTSSQYYYKKNFKIKYENGFYDNNLNWSEHYKLRGEDSKKEKTFTYKADVASSEGANNVVLVRYFEDSKNWFSPPEMEPDIDLGTEDSKKRIRVGIDGIPMVTFHKDKFYGKMNFNNDKGNNRTYGFIEGDECWEFLHNSSNLVLFKTDDLESINPATGKKMWEESFESRYPEEVGADEHPYGQNPGELDKLKKVLTYVASTYRKAEDPEEVKQAKLNKFRSLFLPDSSVDAEVRFDLDSTLFYYLFTELFLMVDSRAKNAMLCWYTERTGGDGRRYGNKWYWLPYDMDTALGINNEGLLVYNYDKEDTDLQEGMFIFNGQDSVFWQNVRDAFSSELSALYSTLRSNNVGREIWSFDVAEKYFEDHQAIWCENIFNEDAYSKYLEPYILNRDATYLGMAQGAKTQQRRWWMYNRFKYLDSKYRAGDLKSNAITLRAYNTVGQKFEIIPYTNCYMTGNFWEIPITKKAEKGKVVEIESPSAATGTDAVINVYPADWIQDLGDISSFMPGYADFSKATKLQRLIIGNASPTFQNGNLKGLNVGANKLLTYLDARNCQNLGTIEGSESTPTIDLKECLSIEEVYFEGTQIKGVTFPNGGNLKVVHLPNTITQLTIRNHPNLRDVTIAGTQNLTSLWLEDIPSTVVNPYKYVMEMPDGSRIRLINVEDTFKFSEETGKTAADQIREFYDKLDKMAGYDSRGTSIDKAQITGKLHVDFMAYKDWHELTTRYPEVLIESISGKDIICTVKFYNYVSGESDEMSLYASRQCSLNTLLSPAEPIADPSRASSVPLDYHFERWYTIEDTVHVTFDPTSTVVTRDLEIYPEYSSTPRKYTVTFEKQTGIASIDVTPSSETVDYNSLIIEPVVSGIPEGLTFHGWHTIEGTHWHFDKDRVLKDLTLYAYWVDENTPTVDLSAIVNCNTFEAHCTDDVGITGWTVAHSAEEPVAWNLVVPAEKTFIKQYSITTPERYYFWVRDNAYPTPKTASAYLQGLSITKKLGTGVDNIQLYYKNGDVYEPVDTTAVFHNSTIKIKATLDSHYENLRLYLNNKEIINDSEQLILENAFIEANCTPKNYVVKFDLGQMWEKNIPDQICPYKTLVTEPEKQVVGGYVVEGWYRTKVDGTYMDKWDFSKDVVEGDTILYARWTDTIGTTRLTLDIANVPQEVTLNYFQSKENIITIDWGDGNKETPATQGRISLQHTYETAGIYYINFEYNITDSTHASNNGTYYLGTDNIDAPALQPITLLTDVNFANNTTTTGNYAFRGATGLTQVQLSPYMRRVAVGAFAECTNLQKVILHYGIATIEGAAFVNCTSLTSLSLPDGLDTIGNEAFGGCLNLSVTKWPKSLRRIEGKAFLACRKIVSLTLDNLDNLGNAAFGGCNALTDVTLSNIRAMDEKVFVNCANLTKVTLLDDTIQPNCAFEECPKLTSAGPLGSGCSIEYNWKNKIPANAFAASQSDGTYIDEVILSDNIVELGSGAFSRSRITKVNLDNIITWGDGVFFGCKRFNLTKFPKKMTYIPTNTFSRCNALCGWDLNDGIGNRIDIPATVNSIGNNAFAHCTRLVTLNVRTQNSTNKINQFDNSWVYFGNPDMTIHVHSNLEDPEEAYGPCFNYWNAEEERRVAVIKDL